MNDLNHDFDVIDAECEIDPRFADPTIQLIRHKWRVRQAHVKAKTKLALQSQALLRGLTAGDKTEAGKIWMAIQKQKPHPLAVEGFAIAHPYIAAMVPLQNAQKELDKEIEKLAKKLPITSAINIKGIGPMAIGKIVGELGDLSAYTGRRAKHAMWKRAGLGVINGERQRLVAGNKSLAIEHGYSPSRRAVFYVMAEAMFKAQGKDENAGPYRLIYDARKAYEIENTPDITKAHAHNRALRYMMKVVLRDIQTEWKRIA